MAVDVVVSGATGRMGAALARLIAADAEYRLAGGIARESRPENTAGDDGAAAYPRIATPADAAELIDAADVVIDFSAPSFLMTLLEQQSEALAGCALVSGTTGLDDAHERTLDALGERCPVLVASNFSPGVNVLLNAVERMAAALPAGDYDVEIVETHHRRKADAPSGTALALGGAAARARGADIDDVRRDGRSGQTGERAGGEIGFHAVRGGGVTGEHEMRFLGEREQIVLTHRAMDRALFAEGALRAADWLAGRDPGRYTLRAVLGLD